MKTARERICRACFGILFVVGVGFLLMAFTVVPVLPHFQLDAVISPSELADPHRRAATLALLQRAAGNQWLFWMASGVVVIVTSGIGLRASLGLECGENSQNTATGGIDPPGTSMR